MDPPLARVVETREGELLTMAAVRDTITHLFSLGRFDDVRVDATVVAANRVSLRYELSPIHPVTRIAFEGELGGAGVDASRLRRAVVDRYGPSPPLGRAAEAAVLMADVLRESGYLHAEIKPRVDVAHQPDRATLVFSIMPGPRTTIDAIEILGTAPGAQAICFVGSISPAAPRTAARRSTPRIDRYIADRRKAGYYEAQAGGRRRR